jgi:hypothetical protein
VRRTWFMAAFGLFMTASSARGQVGPGDLLATVTGRGVPCTNSDAVAKIDKSTGATTIVSGCDASTGQLVGSGPAIYLYDGDTGGASIVSDGEWIFVVHTLGTVHKIIRIDPTIGIASN